MILMQRAILLESKSEYVTFAPSSSDSSTMKGVLFLQINFYFFIFTECTGRNSKFVPELLEDFSNRKTANAKSAVLKFSIKLARILHFIVSVSEKIPPETNHSGGKYSVLYQSANSLVERVEAFSTSLKI